MMIRRSPNLQFALCKECSTLMCQKLKLYSFRFFFQKFVNNREFVFEILKIRKCGFLNYAACNLCMQDSYATDT